MRGNGIMRRILGVILAGGLSRRMGGGDKALLPLGGGSMLLRVAARLMPQVDAMILNANGPADRFAGLGLPVVPDSIADFPGPLAGILAAMEWTARKYPDVSHVLSVAADTPFLPLDLAARLAAGAPEGGIAIACSPSGLQPVFGLWPVALRDDLSAFLGTGKGAAVRDFVARHPHAEVPFPVQPGGSDPFFNVNTPGELEQARAMLRPPPVFGITGWKNSGKTTLVTRVIAELVRRGYRVSSVKHAHHAFDIDQPGRDSFRHREAGASEVMIVSGHRWALMHEARGEPEPDLAQMLPRLSPCDIVIVEGYKREAHPKLEVRRREGRKAEPLAPCDPSIVAIASDHETETAGLPLFDLDDAPGVAGFIEKHLGLARR